LADVRPSRPDDAIEANGSFDPIAVIQRHLDPPGSGRSFIAIGEANGERVVVWDDARRLR
jgi:hypothetical protein